MKSQDLIDLDAIDRKKLEQCVLLIAEIMSDEGRYTYFKNRIAELRAQIDSH